VNCETVRHKIGNVSNCTQCEKWTTQKIKPAPEFKFDLANTNGQSIHFEVADLLKDDLR
jgi:hypothetical protein